MKPDIRVMNGMLPWLNRIDCERNIPQFRINVQLQCGGQDNTGRPRDLGYTH